MGIIKLIMLKAKWSSYEACTVCQKTFMYYRFQPISTISKSVSDGLQQEFKENFSPKNGSRSNPD